MLKLKKNHCSNEYLKHFKTKGHYESLSASEC